MTLFIERNGIVKDGVSDTIVATFEDRKQARIFIRTMVACESLMLQPPHNGVCEPIAEKNALLENTYVELPDGSWRVKKKWV